MKIRIKDKHARVLGQMAREVNLVWNFVNETSIPISGRVALAQLWPNFPVEVAA